MYKIFHIDWNLVSPTLCRIYPCQVVVIMVEASCSAIEFSIVGGISSFLATIYLNVARLPTIVLFFFVWWFCPSFKLPFLLELPLPHPLSLLRWGWGPTFVWVSFTIVESCGTWSSFSFMAPIVVDVCLEHLGFKGWGLCGNVVFFYQNHDWRLKNENGFFGGNNKGLQQIEFHDEIM